MEGRSVSINERIRALGHELPGMQSPIGSYVPATRVGDLVWTSGQLPLDEGRIVSEGRLGDEVDIEAGKLAARFACLNGLAAVADLIGNLELVRRVVKITGFVSSTSSFHDHSLVLDGASSLIGDIFDERGRHVRSAVGVASLPKGSCVEIELCVEVE